MNSDPHQQLVLLLKKKGIGKTMSKTLTIEEVDSLNTLFCNHSTSLITKATLLTALLSLEPNHDEKVWIQQTIQNPQHLPKELHCLLPNKATTPFEEIIQHQISGQTSPENDFKNALNMAFDPKTPGYLLAAFLESARLKRETLNENQLCLDYLVQHTTQQTLKERPFIIDLCNAYDGFNRTPNLTPFLAPLLASVGAPCVLHGIKSVAPKHGITPHKILLEAHKNPLQTPLDCVEELSTLGWTYIDQHHFCPSLEQLVTLRTEMVKRPMLATLEKYCRPLKHPTHHYIVTGYTHPAYKDLMPPILTTIANKFLLMRGVEGSLQLNLDRPSRSLLGTQETLQETFIRPSDVDIPELALDPNPELTVKETLSLGLSALQGKKGHAYYSLLYLGLHILTSFDIMPEKEAKTVLTNALDTGIALECWSRGLE